VNVNIGTKHGPENFFKMNFWNDRPTVPRFYTEYGECNASLKGATEGSMYPSKLKKDSVLWYWRKTLCRPVPLHFEKEVQHHMMTGYKFLLRFDVFDRLEKQSDDCYRGDNLPSGLSDLSRCFFGIFIIFFLLSFLIVAHLQINQLLRLSRTFATPQDRGKSILRVSRRTRHFTKATQLLSPFLVLL
jgi:hypothetical protein